MDDEKKIIEEQLQKLPPELRKAIESTPWKSSIKEIAISNNLSFEQVELAERETMFIIYGFENPVDYIDNLVREVGISEEVATNIAIAVDEKILKVISQQIEKNSSPTIITKSEALEELKRRREQAVEAGAVVKPVPPSLPVVEPDFARSDLVVKAGEVAHEVAHTEPVLTNSQKVVEKTPEPVTPPKPATPPAYGYPGGKDPYREPLE